MKIKIKSLTTKGRDAIAQHVKESKSLKVRLVMNRFFLQNVLNTDPYILLVTVKEPYSSLMKFKDVTPKLEEALIKNGATSKDYVIEEVL